MTSFVDIEYLRYKLYRVIEHCQGNLLDPRVIGASQKLDRALIHHMSGKETKPHRIGIPLKRSFTSMRHAAAK